MKGCGEAGTVGALAAISNAVLDALWTWQGVRQVEMPLTPSRDMVNGSGRAGPGTVPRRSPMRLALLAFLMLAAGGPAPAAAETETQPVAARSNGADPCNFYRVRARGKGINHYLTEVVWACEMVVQRRETGVGMSERMVAVEFALEQYREALVEDRRNPRVPAGLRGTALRAAQEAERDRIAEESGMLAALEAIRLGF
jgi:hypothetical protein